MEALSEVPIISSVVNMNFCPSLSSAFPPEKSRSLISGPFVSSNVATGSFSSPLIFTTLANFFLCSSWLPWEKLKRATFIPASISSLSLSSLSLAGPIVQIIFVRLILFLSPLLMLCLFFASYIALIHILCILRFFYYPNASPFYSLYMKTRISIG